jgi:hypothetical protein
MREAMAAHEQNIVTTPRAAIPQEEDDPLAPRASVTPHEASARVSLGDDADHMATRTSASYETKLRLSSSIIEEDAQTSGNGGAIQSSSYEANGRVSMSGGSDVQTSVNGGAIQTVESLSYEANRRASVSGGGGDGQASDGAVGDSASSMMLTMAGRSQTARVHEMALEGSREGYDDVHEMQLQQGATEQDLTSGATSGMQQMRQRQQGATSRLQLQQQQGATSSMQLQQQGATNGMDTPRERWVIFGVCICMHMMYMYIYWTH